MKNRYLKYLFPIALVAALVLSMLGAHTVLADDAPPTPTEEVPTETPPVEPSSIEEAPTEAPPVEPSPTEEVPTEIPLAEPTSTEEPATPSESTDETVPEIMEQIPDETALIVLDENGEPLPLVSNEAADILITGDPQWCMDGYTPADDSTGGTYCTAKFTKFNGVGGLIEELTNSTGIDTGPGTIYISYDYNATLAGDAGSNIVFDYGNVDLTDLIVQGGWDFTQDKVVGTSTIDLGSGFYVDFWDWGGYGDPGSLTLKDIVFENMGGLGIGSQFNTTTADVTFENVEVGNTDHGADIRTEGNVEINNSTFNYNSNGVYIESKSNVTLNNVWAEWNTLNGAFMYVDGNVVVSNSTFNNNSGMDGVYIESYGNVTLTDVWVEGNGTDGAYIGADGDVTITDSTFKDNYYAGAYIDTCGCGTGNVFVQSSSFVENGDRGLVVYAFGNITVKDIQAELNEVGGVELDNCAGFFFFGGCTNTNPSTITMTGANIIKDNGYNPVSFMGGPDASVGLWAISAGDISIEGATVTGNGAGDIGGGAFFFTENGNLTIRNSTFSNNCSVGYCKDQAFGLITLSGYDLTLDGVTANSNGNGDSGSGTPNSISAVGAFILGNGNVFVRNSSFNDNCASGVNCAGGGLLILTNGNVYLSHVNANGNGIGAGGLGFGGAAISASGNVDVYCSNFNNNDGDGLEVDIPGALTLNGVTFTGNSGTDFIPPSSGTWSVNPFDCVPASDGSAAHPSNLPLKIVNVAGGNSTDLDCENFSGTKLILSNGDNMVVPCPLGGSASLKEQTKDGLPSALPDGSVFRSGLVSLVSENGETTGKLSQYVLISFVMPEGVDASDLAILYWDGAQWVEVDGEFVFSENGESYFAAYVNYTGTFVLVQR